MKTKLKLVFAMMLGVSIGVTGGIAIRGQQVKTLPGYVIAEAEITDPAALQDYGKKIVETLAPFNHRYVVSTSKIQALEGDAPKDRVVVIEFDSVQKAREWYDSPAYAAIRPIRQSAAKSRIFIVEGVPPQ
ncbi:MAG TPA: DUF1330 domain-containing protein [Terracidiphilus sp.]|nr:DUF1330 domain-containing protein [Terracidiphilus sp.]